MSQEDHLLEKLFDVPVIERMIEICGASNMAPVLNSYDHFLHRLQESEVRNRLKALKREEREDPLFRPIRRTPRRYPPSDWR
jgi:hypothetical protein